MHPRLRLFFRRLEIRWARRWSPLKTAFFLYLGFLLVFAFVGDRGLRSSFRLWVECQKHDRENFRLQKDIQKLERQVKLFRSDRRTIERYAREELHLAGDHEIHYIFP